MTCLARFRVDGRGARAHGANPHPGRVRPELSGRAGCSPRFDLVDSSCSRSVEQLPCRHGDLEGTGCGRYALPGALRRHGRGGPAPAAAADRDRAGSGRRRSCARVPRAGTPARSAPSSATAPAPPRGGTSMEGTGLTVGFSSDHDRATTAARARRQGGDLALSSRPGTTIGCGRLPLTCAGCRAARRIGHADLSRSAAQRSHRSAYVTAYDAGPGHLSCGQPPLDGGESRFRCSRSRRHPVADAALGPAPRRTRAHDLGRRFGAGRSRRRLRCADKRARRRGPGRVVASGWPAPDGVGAGSRAAAGGPAAGERLLVVGTDELSRTARRRGRPGAGDGPRRPECTRSAGATRPRGRCRRGPGRAVRRAAAVGTVGRGAGPRAALSTWAAVRRPARRPRRGRAADPRTAGPPRTQPSCPRRGRAVARPPRIGRSSRPRPNPRRPTAPTSRPRAASGEPGPVRCTLTREHPPVATLRGTAQPPAGTCSPGARAARRFGVGDGRVVRDTARDVTRAVSSTGLAAVGPLRPRPVKLAAFVWTVC
jgi:hypothetical protein